MCRILGCAGALWVAGCLLALPAARAANFSVTATTALTFTPGNLTIQVGDSVTWTNVGGAIHNVVSTTGGFRCANGCDDTGGNGEPSGNNWSFTRTFNQAGTFVYFCTLHGGPNSGMRGTIVVAGGAPDTPGTLRFSQAGYAVTEGTANATIAVSRINGDDGAVSISFGAAAGTATAGQDFTPVSGTLSWADNDDANKSFNVPILNNTVAESAETVLLTLASPTGGATLDPARSSATLTIQDNDAPGPGGTAPAAPTGLQTAATSTSEIALLWADHANNETGFKIERRGLTGAYQEVATAPANATGAPVPGLDPATFYSFRVRATNATGDSGYSNEAGVATDAPIAPCVAGPTTLCVNNSRFKIEVGFRRSASGPLEPGNAQTVPTAPDSGLFYFFSPSNLEMLIKVLNACVFDPGRYWVFYAATTDVEFTITLTDTQRGKVKVYFNPLGTAAPPVQDTGAFATCP